MRPSGRNLRNPSPPPPLARAAACASVNPNPLHSASSGCLGEENPGYEMIRRPSDAIVLIIFDVMSAGRRFIYSPELDERGTSVKAANAIAYIMNKLQLSIFGSAHVVSEQ